MPLVTALVAALSLSAQAPTLDRAEVDRFVRELRTEIARDERAAVAARVRYPLIVFAGGTRIPIRDAAALQQNFDLVFPPALKAIIASTAPASTSEAATIGANVQIRRDGDRLRITRIDIPLTAPAVPPAYGGPARRRAAPDRLVVDVGEVRRAGLLAAGARDSYVFFAAKNRLAEIRVTGVRGRDIVVRIVRAKDDAPLDGRAREGTRTWIGRVPDDGDYRIDVVRTAAGADPMAYQLVVSLR